MRDRIFEHIAGQFETDYLTEGRAVSNPLTRLVLDISRNSEQNRPILLDEGSSRDNTHTRNCNTSSYSFIKFADSVVN